MPGNKDIGMVLLVGAFIVLISLGGGGGGLISYAALLVGLALVVKLALAIRGRNAGAPDPATRRASEVAMGMMRTSIAMAAVDGQLAGSERVVIRAIAREIGSHDLDDRGVEKIFLHFISDSSALAQEVAALAALLNAGEARQLLKFAAMVAYADGDLSEAETAVLDGLCRDLQIPPRDRSIQLQVAFGEIQRIVREEQQVSTDVPEG
ncbi:Uncharacterized conserved protein, tellurite resistance protein B (TerB) family [Pseudooceanicola antarcticus]|uniref:TerB family tellurite resistance protein n=1 Tax=Pseudooceanicola antarcticus TaxID=1247613 RepID=A0A285IKT8_9RHOB|nr:TerB family tellurite resistance protein [Pseudooceanicola antarcticus]PJE28914.1 TerB family tellurite resistance protein [Pseudooceanicola antarcticus]SNY47716.1 Uncharacterized conserved protein, tellurite resistance protein B (TerB) family [Pseudooceanicola antarcticus]